MVRLGLLPKGPRFGASYTTTRRDVGAATRVLLRVRRARRTSVSSSNTGRPREHDIVTVVFDGSSGHRKTTSDGRDRYDLLVPKRRADDRIRHRDLRVHVRDRAPVRPTRTDFVPTGVDGDRLRSVRNSGTTTPGGILF